MTCARTSAPPFRSTSHAGKIVDYVAAIRNLRPRVIVVAARDGELAANSAALLAVLVRQFGVTVASLTLTPDTSKAAHLLIQELGANMMASVASLDDVHLG